MNQDEFKALRNSVSRIARSMVPGHLFEDAVSVGLEAVLEAKRKGIVPNVVVRRRILDYYRKETNGRSKNPPKFVSIDDALHLAAKEKPLIEFSKNELRMLELLQQGKTYKEIANVLQLSSDSVDYGIATCIYKRLGVHRRQDAIAEALRLGILAPSGDTPWQKRFLALEQRITALERELRLGRMTA